MSDLSGAPHSLTTPQGSDGSTGLMGAFDLCPWCRGYLGFGDSIVGTLFVTFHKGCYSMFSGARPKTSDRFPVKAAADV